MGIGDRVSDRLFAEEDLMAARAIASGTISFGLVSVPVKLYTGTQSKSLSFNLLHEKDKSRLRQQYVCSGCGEVVERNEMIKGYEYAKGQYAILSPDELKALESQSDQSIEIEEFVPIAEIDPIYFDRAYLLGPDKGGNKAYRLLREAMQRAGKGAVARFSTRGRQQLVLVRQAQDGLMMHSLYYADEVRDFGDVELGDEVALKPNEIDLAVQLVDQLASDAFDPTKYEDEYRKSALAMIEQKIAGEEIAVAPAQAPKGQIIDLMEALKASLEAKQKKPAAAAKAAGRKPARGREKAAAPRKVAGKK
jgi:DNA end-binding protein Ku